MAPVTSMSSADVAGIMTAALSDARSIFASNHIVPRNSNGQVGMMRDQTRQIVAAVNNAASAVAGYRRTGNW